MNNIIAPTQQDLRQADDNARAWREIAEALAKTGNADSRLISAIEAGDVDRAKQHIFSGLIRRSK